MADSQSISQVAHTDGLLMVSLSGEITFHERNSVREILTDLSKATPVTGIEIDLQQVSCIDSSGLALLVDMYKRFNGQISVIVAGSSQPDRLLRRANITTFLNVRSVPSAKTSVQ